jgi:hypothetical protein
MINEKIKAYIDSLNIEDIPWHRMFTAYGTAENYPTALSELGKISDYDEWKEIYYSISDFEHQSTMCQPAPFALVFLVRILEKLIESNSELSDIKAEKMLDYFIYLAEVCYECENLEHSEPLENFSDMLDEKYLLSEYVDDDELEEVFENPDFIPDDLFYSFYYYSEIVLSQIPDILNKNKKFADKCEKIKNYL